MLQKTKNRLYWERAVRLFSRDSGIYKHLRYLNKKKFKGVYSEGEVAKFHSSTADTIMSLTEGELGYGHKIGYFKSRFNYRYFQFIAHCAESYHIGNPLLEQLFPEMYKEMTNLWEELIK